MKSISTKTKSASSTSKCKNAKYAFSLKSRITSDYEVTLEDVVHAKSIVDAYAAVQEILNKINRYVAVGQPKFELNSIEKEY